MAPARLLEHWAFDNKIKLHVQNEGMKIQYKVEASRSHGGLAYVHIMSDGVFMTGPREGGHREDYNAKITKNKKLKFNGKIIPMFLMNKIKICWKYLNAKYG